MAKLPSVSSRKAVKVFRSFGWEVVRRELSHVIMVKGKHSNLVGAGSGGGEKSTKER